MLTDETFELHIHGFQTFAAFLLLVRPDLDLHALQELTAHLKESNASLLQAEQADADPPTLLPV